MNSLPIAVSNPGGSIHPTGDHKKNIAQGSFITWMLSRRGISMRLIADAAECHFDTVSKTIWGKRNAKDLQDFIALVLHFSSWEDLKKAEVKFNEHATEILLKELSA